jgi:predicted metal-dependent hydrolase
MKLPIPALDPFQSDLHAIHPALQLRVSVRARRMALRVDPQTGRVNLVVPKRASLKKALEFARQYQDWIGKQASNQPTGIALRHGAVIPLLGQNRTIVVCRNPDLKRTTISFSDNEITVVTNQDDPSMRILRYLKKLARDEITRIANEKAALIDRKINTITIRDTSSRWGSCSQDGNLSFSWRLILAPTTSLDYVVAHEVAHLVHLNHKTRFWALCAKLSADFENGHGWMKKHAQDLMRYG